jgi:hypothetical protein
VSEEILDGIRDMYDAFLMQDRARFDSHLGAEVTTWESHLPRMVTRPELDRYRDERPPSARPTLAELRVEPGRVDVTGDLAIARYPLIAVAQKQQAAEISRVTDVLRRTDAGWVIVHHQAELSAAETARASA